MSLTVGVVSFTALLDSINPCAISVLLLTMGFLMGMGRRRLFVLKIGGVYILGIYLTYLGIGLGILKALSVFFFPHILVRAASLVLGISATVNLLGALIPKFPIRLKIPESVHPKLAEYIQTSTAPAALMLGVLVGLFEFPCTGGPYLLILGLLHDRATFWSGFGYLAYYNAIFVLPLVVILLLGSNARVLDKIDKWRKTDTRKADIATSVILLVLAAVMFMTS